MESRSDRLLTVPRRSHVGPEKPTPTESEPMMASRAARTWDTISSIMLTTSELERLSARAPHGTHGRYNAHLLAGDEPCDACRDAEAEYRAELRARRAGQGGVEQPRSQITILRSRSFDPDDIRDDEDDQGFDDEEELEDERSWADDLEDAEGLELDAAPRWRRSVSTPEDGNPSPFGPAFGKIRVGPQDGQTYARRNAPHTSMRATDEVADPKARLRAITATLDARHPAGREAIELLVEAASYLNGGVSTLHQYGEARGCDPEDVTAAERAVVGAQERRRPA